MINTRFWDDTYTSNLDPIEKLLFLYFLTNTSTSICGVYEIPLKKIANETGIDKEMVEKILSRFERDNKVVFRDGWIGVINFIKNQNQQSPKVKKGIEIELAKCPNFMKDIVLGKGMDTLSHSNTNSNLTKLNTSAKAEGKAIKFNPLGAEILKAFEEVDPKNKTYYANKTQRSSCDFLIDEYGLDKVLQAIKILPKINTQKLYIKQITTPYELKENWVKVGNAVKQKVEQKNKVAF